MILKSYKEFLEEGVLKIPIEVYNTLMNFILLNLAKQFNGKKSKLLTTEANKYKPDSNVRVMFVEEDNLYFCIWYPEHTSLPDSYKKHLNGKQTITIYLDKRNDTNQFNLYGTYNKRNNMITYYLNNEDSRNFIFKHNVNENDFDDFMFQLTKTLKHELSHMIDNFLKIGRNDKQLRNLSDYDSSPVEYEQKVLDHIENFLLVHKDTTPETFDHDIKDYISKADMFKGYTGNKYKKAYNKFYTELHKLIKDK